MERPVNLSRAPKSDNDAVDQVAAGAIPRPLGRVSLAKTRSLSDSEGTPSKLSPSPHIIESSRATSKDDSSLASFAQPVTPRRPSFNPNHHLASQMPRDATPPPAAAATKLAPLSPKLDHSQIYASPTNILPRRSRGLDFSRAATSLHHSTLAEQSSPESSPTIGGGRAMNIPSRTGEYIGGPEQQTSSLWSIMGSQEKMNISGSVGSTQAVGSDSSGSSDENDLMDEDMDEALVTTPQAARGNQGLIGTPFASPAMSSLMSFQQRQRPRRQHKKKSRGMLNLGFGNPAAPLPKSPPSHPALQPRRESISWQANQLHISNAEAEDSGRTLSDADSASGDGQRNVIRRPVTRRGNLLPKTKTFARIRAALMEEGAPAEAECRREAEVVKQVRESDADLEPRVPQHSIEPSGDATALSSPNSRANQDLLDDIPEDDKMGELSMALSSSFKQHAMKNSKGKSFWDTFSETGSTSGARITPPPAAFFPRGSSSGVSEDVAMDSPSLFGQSGSTHKESAPPTAAEITRRINNKRRREDDFDPLSFKRRAVSPGMSVHNSPILQSPMQRESVPWGSRPGSNGGDKAGSSAPSDSGSMSGTPGNPTGGSGTRVNGKARVGFQGMSDTNDGIMRMSIE